MKDQLTPLKETGIYIVNKMPLDLAECDHFHLTNVSWDKDARIQCSKKMSDGKLVLKGYYILRGLNANDWDLHTITSDIISFDPAPYLEKEIVDIFYDGFEMYRDYMDDPETFIIDPEESFRSLLTSCGYYWVNPLGSDICTHGENNNYCENVCQGSCWQKAGVDSLEWQSFEDNLVTGILLALIKK